MLIPSSLWSIPPVSEFLEGISNPVPQAASHSFGLLAVCHASSGGGPGPWNTKKTQTSGSAADGERATSNNAVTPQSFFL